MKTFIPAGLLLLTAYCFITGFKPSFAGKQGIEGYLYRISGNQMPSPDVKRSAPQGIKGVIYIYEITNASQAVRQENTSFYSSLSTKLVRQVQTKNNGYFKVRLPAGRYSLFIKKDSVFYANRFDSDNNIAPVEVLPKKMTRVEVRQDYNAVY